MHQDKAWLKIKNQQRTLEFFVLDFSTGQTCDSFAALRKAISKAIWHPSGLPDDSDWFLKAIGFFISMSNFCICLRGRKNLLDCHKFLQISRSVFFVSVLFLVFCFFCPFVCFVAFFCQQSKPHFGNNQFWSKGPFKLTDLLVVHFTDRNKHCVLLVAPHRHKKPYRMDAQDRRTSQFPSNTGKKHVVGRNSLWWNVVLCNVSLTLGGTKTNKSSTMCLQALNDRFAGVLQISFIWNMSVHCHLQCRKHAFSLSSISFVFHIDHFVASLLR